VDTGDTWIFDYISSIHLTLFAQNVYCQLCDDDRLHILIIWIGFEISIVGSNANPGKGSDGQSDAIRGGVAQQERDYWPGHPNICRYVPRRGDLTTISRQSNSFAPAGASLERRGRQRFPAVAQAHRPPAEDDWGLEDPKASIKYVTRSNPA